jgi:serine/threonine protein kinase/Tol biopolymer transport system component
VPLSPGTSLGPYEIAALIGAGGMGEVYRARDTRLDRIVAVKVLPAALSAQSDLRQRLEREARTISSLAHAHICTLFDVGTTPDGATFLVMEHLEGESLAERISRGPVPFKQALRIGAEIAEALDAAHKRGIVHRDLKPGNVMLTKSGVKLLDFGLAKAVSGDGGVVSDPTSPTVQQQNDLTAEGHIVGTLQYMAPEQLEGHPTDGRTDIFALGATLYEMLSGRRAFHAASRAGLIAAILHEDPPPLTNVPPPVARLVAHCLMKDPDERWQTARDVAIQLRGAADVSGSETMAAPSKARGHLVRNAAIALALVAAGALIALIAQRSGKPARSSPAAFSHLSIDLSPQDDRLALANEVTLAISPDGEQVLFSASENGRNRFYLRRTDSFEITPIAGTEDATTATFSPDGKQIAFAARGKLQRFELAGGTPEALADVGPVSGISWGSDGTLVLNLVPSGPLMSLPATGGPAVRVEAKGIDDNLVLPDYEPEHNLLLAVREIQGKSFDESEIVALSLETHEPKVVARGTSPRFVASREELLFARAGRIWSVPFDAKKLELRGTPTMLIDGVLSFDGNGVSAFAVSDTGDIVYAPFSAQRFAMRLMLVGRDGRTEPLPFPPGQYQSPSLSADGHTLAIETLGANNDVWLGDLQRGTLNRLTSTQENLCPVISPDGRQLIVSRYHAASSFPRLHLLRTDGVGEPTRLGSARDGIAQFVTSWSHDGRLVAYTHHDRGGVDVYLLSLADGGKETPLLTSRFDETAPALSPDGRWLAYASDETGASEIYVRSIADAGTKTRISTDGGTEPLWGHNGRELYYRRGDAVMSASVSLGSPTTAAAPVHLFDFPGHSRDVGKSWDVMPDDRHFVMIERSAAAGSMRTLHVVRR